MLDSSVKTGIFQSSDYNDKTCTTPWVWEDGEESTSKIPLNFRILP